MAICNLAGINLIKSFEKLELLAYDDGTGVWTVGRGHTGEDVHPGLVWTKEKADNQFLSDLHTRAEWPVSNYVKVPLTHNQFAALCSLTYNIGAGNLHTSTLLKVLNAGHYDQVAEQIERWNKSHGMVLNGLTRRCDAEVELWNTPDPA